MIASLPRKRRIIQNPDMTYSNWHYDLGDCHTCDVDWVETTPDGKPLAMVETIKGIGKVITPYKRKVYENLSNLSGVPFYVVNYDFQRRLFTLTNQQNITIVKSETEYKAWLRSLRRGR